MHETVERVGGAGRGPAPRADAPDGSPPPPTSATGGRRASTIPLLARRRALPADRGQPHDPVLPADLPRRDDPDPPAPQVPPHRARRAPSSSRSDGSSPRYEKRGREYVDIEVAVITADAPDRAAVDVVGHVHADRDAGSRVTERRATLHVTEELVRAYSRRGNFHSDAETAAALGMPGSGRAGRAGRGPGVRPAARRVGRGRSSRTARSTCASSAWSWPATKSRPGS